MKSLVSLVSHIFLHCLVRFQKNQTWENAINIARCKTISLTVHEIAIKSVENPYEKNARNQACEYFSPDLCCRIPLCSRNTRLSSKVVSNLH